MAVVLGVLTSGTKFVTGWWAAHRSGTDPRAWGVAGAALVPRGEFSLAIAGLATAASVEADLGPVTVAYVVFTVVLGSVLTRLLARRADRVGAGRRGGSARLTRRIPPPR